MALLNESIRRLFDETVSGMEDCVHELSERFEPPILTDQRVFRHRDFNKHEILVLFLKTVRLVSLLNAALVLAR